jgi:hypothetical protein
MSISSVRFSDFSRNGLETEISSLHDKRLTTFTGWLLTDASLALNSISTGHSACSIRRQMTSSKIATWSSENVSDPSRNRSVTRRNIVKCRESDALLSTESSSAINDRASGLMFGSVPTEEVIPALGSMKRVTCDSYLKSAK